MKKNLFLFDKFNISKEYNILNEIKKKFSEVKFIFDICNQEKLKNKKKLLNYFKKISFFSNVYLIDGGFNESILKLTSNLKVKGIITPYFSKEEKKVKSKHYAGIKYFVFNPKTKIIFKKIFKLKNFLISFGNSDPKKLSLFALKNLIKLNRKLNIRVIIGPMFNHKMTDQIKILAKKYKKSHNIKIFFNQKNLINQFNWCDFSIISCGLTKYEAILFCKPSIVIPFNHKSEQLSVKLKKRRLLFLSENISKLNNIDFYKFLNSVIHDEKKITNVIKNCKNLKLNKNNKYFIKVINFEKKK